jgi:hypothetical protein
MKTKVFKDPVHLTKFLAKGHKARVEDTKAWCYYKDQKTGNPFMMHLGVMDTIWKYADGKTAWEIEKKKKPHPRTKSHKALGVTVATHSVVYVANPSIKSLYFLTEWLDSINQQHMYENNLTFSTEEDARAMAKKMIKMANKDN